MYKEIQKCRICGNTELISVLNLGDQALTGIFPPQKTYHVDIMPLELVKCADEKNLQACGLVQLKHNGDLSAMYGMNYGYRSGLNASMVKHLQQKVARIQSLTKLQAKDLVIDIGSNDSTLLQAYPDSLQLVGIDPTGIKFKSYYPAHIQLIPEFFSAKAVQEKFGTKKAKIVSSISMFYDLEAPMEFMKQVYDVLDQEGLWMFEQSYMPTMVEANSYDTACHEHLEYYGLKQIKFMTDKVGFKIIDIEFNDINGGSFSLIAAKKDSHHKECTDLIQKILKKEKDLGFETAKPFMEFKKSLDLEKTKLLQFLQQAKKDGKKVFGYGASTKGNVLLQYCNITPDLMPYVAEVNETKFGCYTPGTLIPIISEKEAHGKNPDYYLVLPWHFKKTILGRETNYLKQGGKLVFPLPHFEIVQA